MDDTLLQFGVGGIFAILVLKLVFEFVGHFLEKKREKTGTCVTAEVLRQIDDLWQWHAKTDDEGVKIWYVRRSLEEAITKLTSNLDTQTNILSELVHEMKDMRREFRDKG